MLSTPKEVYNLCQKEEESQTFRVSSVLVKWEKSSPECRVSQYVPWGQCQAAIMSLTTELGRDAHN